MIWLLLAIFSYFLLALTALGDKLLLSVSKLKEPGTYAFFIGIFGLVLFLGIPIFGFPTVSSPVIFLLAFISGAAFILALWPLFTALKKFQASTVIPATGGLQPIFSLFLGVIFLGTVALLSLSNFLALALLITGSVLITLGDKWQFSKECLGLVVFAAFLFALSFVLIKQVYLAESLWYGLLWSRLGGAFMALIFFLTIASVRHEILMSSAAMKKGDKFSSSKTGMVFLLIQAAGALAGLCQQASVYLAPASAIPIINALQGTQYVFLFLWAVVASKKYPKIFGEYFTVRSAFKKTAATFMIILGVALLVF